MTVYEVVNPSDAMTVVANDVRVAQAAFLLVGEGRVGLSNAEGTHLPILFFSADAWVAEHFPEGLSEFIDAHLIEIARCLESVVYGSIEDRAAIIAAVGAEASLDAFARFNEAKRSSMSNYAKAARDIAERLRELAAEAESTNRSFSIRQAHQGDKDGIRLLRTLREALMREFKVKVGDSPFNTTLGASEWINAQPGDPAYEQVQKDLQRDEERTTLAGRASDLVDALAELEQSFEDSLGGEGFTLSIEANI